MRVLFILNTPGFLRYYDETIDGLLERGHEVLLGFTDPALRPEALEALEARERKPQLIGGVPVRADEFAQAAERIRLLVDYARYLHPRFARARALRDRRRTKLRDGAFPVRLLVAADTLPAPVASVLARALLLAEAALPSAPDIESVLHAHAPDVLLVSPLVTGASPQTDYVKAARRLGIPSALCVASWDNLTNKGLIRVQPDRVLVWNEAQRREAIELHGVHPRRVTATGAQPFDRWFDRRPTASREEYCTRLGLDPERPLITFVGSTSNIADARDEDRFVRRWIEALRAAGDPELDGAGIVFRPHPDRRGAWTTLSLDDVPDAVVWPPQRPNSVTPSARGEYFDTLYHSAAIVGINTSAMVEGAIVDRPVLTVRLPELTEAQEGTLHFDHLLPENGGPLLVTRELASHARQLAEILRDPSPAAERNRAFVERFIRPQGRAHPSNERLIAAVEALVSVPSTPLPRSALLLPLRWALREWSQRRATLTRRERRRPFGWRTEAWLRAASIRLERLVPGLEPVRRRLGQRLAARRAKEKERRHAEKVASRSRRQAIKQQS